MKIVILSCSLNQDSNSRILAKLLHERIQNAELLDMRDYPLPHCDGSTAYSNSNVKKLTEKITAAQGILVAAPIYNYSLSSVVKNVIELTGEAWQDKVIGFACAAGGKSSYMAALSLANSLMLDFRSLIIPRFVYAHTGDFKQGKLINKKVNERVTELAESCIKLVEALQ